MCQSLVHKVARSKQLQAVTEPGILKLFESWLDELEEEAAAFLQRHPDSDAVTLADALGLSASGAAFLLAKRQQE
ncbi:conserved hypothetical protein [Desulfurivibrio alkaliphilus AHT 2]|uniref:Uncharacterized protein n=3 Tax=Desulfurivibrio alkaliphilus TaxID=427923 RepID=D6Z426_DESAT|nr:hypothetical protein [Desulfurivibrio alkaliphilus]ADH86301.1 conserved hypothetical protein [Desulfurivibrio alkaliphilus AHT 2]